jgi:hypothetical protein
MTPAGAMRGRRMGSDEIEFAVVQRRAGFSYQAIADQLCRESAQVKDAVATIEREHFLAQADIVVKRIGKPRARQLFLQCAEACE